MKIRSGFVSNSSSSSFIITATPDDKGKVLVTLDFSKLGGEVIKTEYDLRRAFSEKYSDFDTPFAEKAVKELFERCLETIKNNKAVVMGHLDNELMGILEYVSGEAEVLERDGYIEV